MRKIMLIALFALIGCERYPPPPLWLAWVCHDLVIQSKFPDMDSCFTAAYQQGVYK